MSSTAIKEALHNYIDSGDEKLLQMIYAIVREYNNPALSKTDQAEMEVRSMRRKNGKSKTYDWQTAKKIIIGKSELKK
jgi:hypothetical protein